MLIPTRANSTGGSPYSFSKAHLAPRLSANHHSASRALTTNQPSVTGVRPDPESSSRPSCTDAILARRPLARNSNVPAAVREVMAHAGTVDRMDAEPEEAV